MTKVWDQARIQQYIDDGVEESLNLDYKAAGALAKTDGKKKEITKDVSAMANSDGGIIIYGLTENGHLPGNIDPVNRSVYSKEWLEHVIGNIRPRIDDLIVHPVTISNPSSDVVSVVQIPKSHTTHQASDKRYYKRYNFESVMMEDYEIRDVMNRLQHPRLDLTFRILCHLNVERVIQFFELEVTMENSGMVYARYVVAFLHVPCGFISDSPRFVPQEEIDPENLCEYNCENTLVDRNGSTRYVPVLPNIGKRLNRFAIARNFSLIDWDSCEILWAVHADNAPPTYGSIAISEIEVVESID